MKTKIPECPKHKKPMTLIEEGLILKLYRCNEEECKESRDIVCLIMQGQKIYLKKQKETEAKIKSRNIKNLYKEELY
ncbi:hypothetical protein LCGC14_2253280 [marine sediment metagenome]|uniref:Uncharacterized protein n=1 Tax=marine sediment metagenome TaxID=412755 RepID=A0A0F9FWV4_9ZZZZ